jgi:hypothetical protein
MYKDLDLIGRRCNGLKKFLEKKGDIGRTNGRVTD